MLAIFPVRLDDPSNRPLNSPLAKNPPKNFDPAVDIRPLALHRTEWIFRQLELVFPVRSPCRRYNVQQRPPNPPRERPEREHADNFGHRRDLWFHLPPEIHSDNGFRGLQSYI